MYLEKSSYIPRNYHHLIDLTIICLHFINMQVYETLIT